MKRNSEHILDEWLVLSAQAGSEQAFARLLSRWWPKLVTYATRQLNDKELAKEVSQETLLIISQKIGQLNDSVTFPKWAFQILHRRCVDQIRTNQKNRKAADAILENHLEGESIEMAESTRDLSIDIEKALSSMAVDQSQMVYLHYVEGFSMAELSDILGIAKGTVKSRLFAARKQLKQKLEGKNNDN